MPKVIGRSIEQLVKQQKKELSSCKILSSWDFKPKKIAKSLRNLKVFDLASILSNHGSTIEVYDPIVNQDDLK